MNQTMITTNLRLPYSDWLQVKTLAGETRMSLNEYLNYIIGLISKAKQLAVDLRKIPLKPSRTDSIWGWPDLAKKIKFKPMGLSADDELIYG